MDSKQKVIYFLAILIIAVPFLFVILRRITNDDLSATDSDAIYGGRLERSYLSSGYLVSYLDNANATICGFVKLDNNIAITAAHCLDSVDQVFLSADPSEPQLILNAVPVDAYKHPKWDGANSDNDIAVLNYENESNGTETFANVVEPLEGCNYRVVGHGRTSDDEELGIDREKRSTVVCIDRFNDDLIYINGQGGGICMGDSGSPIFEIGTNNVVGLISTVVVKNQGESPCYIDNEGVAVRVDNKLDFVTKVATQIINGESGDGSDVASNQIEGIPNELQLDSSTSGSTLSKLLNTKPGEKIFGMDVELVSKIYFAVIIIFAAFAIKVLAFQKKHVEY